MRIASFSRMGAAAMVALSAVLLLWQHFGMNRVLRIDGHGEFQVAVSDDRSNGGQSVATLKRDDGAFVLDCQLSDSYEWPFCELGITLAAQPEAGLDLSHFDSVVLRADYRAPGSRKLRLFLRNFDPAYADTAKPDSWKINEINFRPEPGGQLLDIPLRNFNVASWWLANQDIPPEHAAVDLRHVPLIQLSTSGLKEPGQHTLRIDYLEFHGKWLSREQLALVLLALWVGASFITLLFDLRAMRARLSRSRRREEELRTLSRALKLENRVIGEMAKRDPMTGVRNRAGIRDELFREAELARQSGHPLAVIFADIDHFKSINDTHGHDVGDVILKQFARETGSQIRNGDYLVRWGGEEFVIICPDTSLSSATLLAEKIRSQLASRAWHNGLKVTCSFGVTVMRDEPIADCLKRADEALYAAKRNGRNRVETAA
ncbi:GGDEF domain-containing protein [Chitinolyticbacter meiyuanensis]|uniref:GGDEF domain-containing protein n=1 Tax=Chitinolyticbacter meiyuanensis TaxID=682798 RepID=UPI0011E5BE7A|nr:GGDEF domain-containing protein [Chitinolyticbacter meiyuanensis]